MFDMEKQECIKTETIPKIIHYCWFGEEVPSNLSQQCMDTWEKIMPDFEIRIHNEKNTEFNTPLLQYLYEKKSWAFISDYIRLRALFEHGGIYLDIDMEAVKPFDPLLKHHLFLGYESKGRLNSSVLGSNPSEAFLKHCMEYMDQRFLEKKPYKIAPEVMSTVYMAHSENITVFKEEYFYPYNPYDDNRDAKTIGTAVITENTYAIHHWEKQWKMGWLERIKRKIL